MSKYNKFSISSFLLIFPPSNELIEASIITEEKKDKQYKIPAICRTYGIETMNITELCKIEGWVF